MSKKVRAAGDTATSEPPAYEVGDKVVHPYHGAGIVASVERSDLVDEFSRYYVIELAAAQMRLMVPVRTAEEIGLRRVLGLDHWPAILDILDGDADHLPDDFKARQTQIHERLKEGTAEALARIVRDMAYRGRDRTYSPTEQRLYDQARSMLGSELALAKDTGVEQALDMIDDLVSADRPPKASGE